MDNSQLSLCSLKRQRHAQRKKLSREDKFMLLAKAIKRTLVLKQKQELWLKLSFLRELGWANPSLCRQKQIKLYLTAVV